MLTKVANTLIGEISPCDRLLNTSAAIVDLNFVSPKKEKKLNLLKKPSKLQKSYGFVVAVRQAVTIIKLVTRSTGTRSATQFSRACNVLKIPLAPVAIRPDGPFQLSTQPGTGSFSDDRTVNSKI